MGLDSIWNDEGDILKKGDRFRARSTGCSCCSAELTTEGKVKKEAIDSLKEILIAVSFFDWDLSEMIEEAKKDKRVEYWKKNLKNVNVVVKKEKK